MNTETGILVRVSFGKFAPKVANKKASHEYASAHGADVAMHKAHMLLVSDEYTQPIQKFESSVRQNFLNVMTIPWERGGSSLLPAKMIDAFMNQVASLRQEHDRLVAEWLSNYDAIVSAAKLKLNGDFDARRYPSREDVSRKFYMEVTYSPLPASGDYRIDVSKELLEEVAAETDRIADARFADARLELRQRLVDKLQHLSDRCKAVNENDKAKWYESNITNLVDLIDIIPKMLLGNDVELEQAIKDARSLLSGIDSDTIKSSEAVRDSVRKKAASIISSLQF